MRCGLCCHFLVKFAHANTNDGRTSSNRPSSVYTVVQQLNASLRLAYTLGAAWVCMSSSFQPHQTISLFLPLLSALSSQLSSTLLFFSHIDMWWMAQLDQDEHFGHFPLTLWQCHNTLLQQTKWNVIKSLQSRKVIADIEFDHMCARSCHYSSTMAWCMGISMCACLFVLFCCFHIWPSTTDTSLVVRVYSLQV